MNILITGSAQGIGAATARLCVQTGHRVGIFDIDAARAKALADELGEHAISGKLDVSLADDWDVALREFTEHFGQLDVLINNAGLLCSGKFEQIELQRHLTQLSVNVNGVLLGYYKARPYLKPHANAKIINLSSAAAIHGQPDLASYAASKFFARGLTEGLDAEWAKDGIRVIDMMPLYTNTGMVVDMQAGSIDQMGVRLQPQDVAQAILKVIEKPNERWQNTHRPVGLQATILHRIAGFAPEWLNRQIHIRMNK